MIGHQLAVLALLIVTRHCGADESHFHEISGALPQGPSPNLAVAESKQFTASFSEPNNIVVDISGSISVDTEPSLLAKAILNVAISHAGTKLIESDITAQFSTSVCDLLRVEFGLAGTISLPGLTDKKPCVNKAGLCTSCISEDNPSLHGIGPYISCEDKNSKLLLDMSASASFQSVKRDFGDLTVSLCKLAADAKDSEVTEFCDYTGSDVVLRVDEKKLVSTWTGVQVPLDLDIRFFDPSKAKDGPLSKTSVKEAVDVVLRALGFGEAIYEKTYNLAEVVEKGLGSKTPAWVKGQFITAGTVGAQCDNATAPFGVRLGVSAAKAKANLEKIKADLASIIKSDGTGNPPVAAYQLQDLRVVASPSACSWSAESLRAIASQPSYISQVSASDEQCWICGTMHSGAGRDAGALNSILAHATANGETIAIGAQQVALEKMATHTSYTCSKDAEENGGCVSSPGVAPPSASGGSQGSTDDEGSTAGVVVGVCIGVLACIASIAGYIWWRKKERGSALSRITIPNPLARAINSRVATP